MTLRNTRRNQELQLETRQAQLFWNIYREIKQKEHQERHFTIASLDYTDYDDFMEKYGPENNPEIFHQVAGYGDTMDGLGVFIREGYIDIRLVAMLNAGDIFNSWRRLQPWIYGLRERHNWPRAGIEFEYLYNSLKDYAEKHPELEIKPPTL